MLAASFVQPATSVRSPSQPSCLITQDGQRQTILKPSLRAADFGLSLLKLRLAQLNDRTQSQFVAGLGKVKRLICLRQQLITDADPIEGCACSQPTGANVARDAVAEIAESLAHRSGAQVGFLGLC